MECYVHLVLKLVKCSRFSFGPSVESFFRTGLTKLEALGLLYEATPHQYSAVYGY